MNKEVLKIKLRPINKYDANLLMELNNNDIVAYYVVGNPKKVELKQQIEWIEKLQYEKNTKRWMIDFEDKTVGTVILSAIDYSNNVANVNIKILPSYQGKGIAEKALKQISCMAFEQFGLVCLTANVLPYNIRSLALFNKVGFQKDGILRSRVIKNGKRYDLITLSLLNSEI